jgi:hypothetical protein
MPEKLRKKSPRLEKMVKNRDAYFSLYWSELRKAEKYDISRHVPSMAGIYELYYRDEHGRIHLMSISRAWYGGLRSKLRIDTDPELVTDARFRQILETYDVYYRYTLTNSMGDMVDVLYFFSKSYLPGRPAPGDSGRYANIFLEEIAPDKLVTI